MTTANNWKVNADGDWSTAADWSLGFVPTSADTVTISTSTVHTITHNSGSDVIDKLTVGNDFFSLGGGSLDILTTASFADGYTQTGGTLQVGAISITGPAELLGGASEGAATFSVTGVATLSNYTLGGASVLTVTSTANETGQITLGDATGVNARIRTATAGVYSIAGDFGIAQGASSASFTNFGTLRKISGSGTSIVAVSVASTGTLSATSGDLQFDGPTNTVSGTLSGGGEISFAGGVTTFGTVTLNVGTLGVYGSATVNLGSNLTFSHAFNDSSNGNTDLNLGAHTFTLSGPSAAFVGGNGVADITGSGTLSNSSVTNLSNVIFGGTVKLSNAKTIDQSNLVTLGDGSGAAPSITNLAAGTYNITDDSNLAVNNTTATFTNQGLLEKTGGVAGQRSVISLALTNTGTIGAQAGALAFNGSLVNTGTISGAGSVQVIDAGAMTLNAGTVLSVANFGLFDTASLTLGASLTYAGAFNDSSNGANQLNLGANTLTLSGARNTIAGSNGTADIAGAGKVVNAGTSTLSLGAAVIDGTAQISNFGVINQSNSITIGGAGGQIAGIFNQKGAHFNITGDFLIQNGAATASHFNNSGAVTVQAGTGSATLATTFTNQVGGTINVATGALQNNGILTNAGTISGAGLVLAGSSQTTLSAGSSLTVAEVDLLGSALLTVGASMTYAGHFLDASNGFNQINLGTSTLTLTGITDFEPANGADVITGTGALKLMHATTFGGATVEVGGAANLDINSKVTATGTLQVGDASPNTAQAVIATTGTYDLLSDSGVGRGASAASTLTNNGLFEKTAGTGTSVVSVDFVNNGTITVTSGKLEFLAGMLSGSGSVNGIISFDMNGNEFITAPAPSAIKASAVHASPGTTGASPARAAGLLAQAAAAFGADGGSAARWDLGATLHETALDTFNGHSDSRRLN